MSNLNAASHEVISELFLSTAESNPNVKLALGGQSLSFDKTDLEKSGTSRALPFVSILPLIPLILF
jgi:hypothetical protein